MKLLTMMGFILLSTMAQASGKVLLTPVHDIDHDKNYLQVGLSIYQNLFGSVYYTNYTGVGYEMMDQYTGESNSDAKNLVFKNGIKVQIMGKLELEPGFQVSRDLHSDYSQELAYLKVGFQVW